MQPIALLTANNRTHCMETSVKERVQWRSHCRSFGELGILAASGRRQAFRFRWPNLTTAVPLHSYRARGVHRSCAKHLTVESYTVVMLPTFILIIISIPSPLTLFNPGLNLPFLQILPTIAFLFFFRTDSTDSPDCLLLLLSISVFYVSAFLFYTF